MKNYYGYIRVSTLYQAEDGLSLEHQKKQILEYAKRENFTITNIFEEIGKSGRNIEKREQLKHVFEIMKKEDVLIVYSFSRLVRAAFDYANIVKLFEKKGCCLIIIKEKYETVTAAGKFLANITAAVAQFESDLISERVKECMRLKKERGEFVGRIPYGWKLENGKGSDLIEVPHEQETIALIKKMRDHKEVITDIIENLNLRNIPPPKKSKNWYPTTIKRILKRGKVITKGRNKTLEIKNDI